MERLALGPVLDLQRAFAVSRFPPANMMVAWVSQAKVWCPLKSQADCKVPMGRSGLCKSSFGLNSLCATHS